MPRILIAEDDPLIGSFLEKGFRANGFTTFLTGDGDQAQALGLSDEFDLLLLDMGLNSRDGFHVLQELRMRGKTLPILCSPDGGSVTSSCASRAGRTTT